MNILDFEFIKNMNLSMEMIYNWCNAVWSMKDKCIMPTKVKMWQGDSGRYITMPCVIPDLDIAGVKFISRNIDDANGIPARNSNILLQKCSQMGPLALVDGIWITNMRTGAIAAHSTIAYSKKDFETLGIMGLGITARAFMLIFGTMYKKPVTIKLLKYKDQAELFIERFQEEFSHFKFEIVDNYEEICSCDTIVSAVSYARDCFASESIFNPGCLVVPIHQGGFQNCDLTFDKIIIDDWKHVETFKYYNECKHKMTEISEVETGKSTTGGRMSDTERIIAYCGGIALHDIYIAYQINKIADERRNAVNINMGYPDERFWI